MGRSPYLDQEPGGVLVLTPCKWRWVLPFALFWGVSLIYGYVLWIAGLHCFVKTTFDYFLLIVQWVSLLIFDVFGVLNLVVLMSGGGGIQLDRIGVWFIGFGGRKGRCIEWKHMNTFSLGWWVFKPPIFARYSKAILGEYYEAKWPNPRFLFCQGPYENIGKAELVELLNRWREKFGGTSEAAS